MEVNNSAGWRPVKLKKVCNKITVGHVGPMATEYVAEGIPFLRSQNIRPFNLDTSSLKYISAEFHRKIKKSALTAGDVVAVRTGYPGTTCVIPNNLKEANCADLVIFRPGPELDSYYLACIFNSSWGKSAVAGSLVGVAQQHFNVGVAKELEVHLPPLETQREIAAILSAYDDLIENNTRRIRILEEMAQSLYREWFVHFRFPGHEKVDMVDSHLGNIPDRWEVASVDDSFEIIGGGTPSKKIDEYWTDGEINWFVPSDLTASKTMFMEQSTKRITELGLRKSSARLFPAHSVMLTSRATIGVVSMNTRTACTNQGFITCIPNEAVPAFFLYHWILENKGTFLSLASGATFKEISKGVFRKIDFLLPAHKIVIQFENCIQPIGRQILNLQRQNANLHRTRDLLLPKLLNGEESDNEVAR